MRIVDRILVLTEEQNITSYRLSKETGVPASKITDWKNDRSEPSLKNLIKLADYFNVSIDYLVGRTDNPEVNK